MDKHLLLSLLIPAAFLGLTGLIKSLVKGDLFWSNFYLGIDIALAAFANGIINFVDLGARLTDGHVDASEVASKMYYNAIGLVLSFGVLLAVMFIHQRMEDRQAQPGKRNWARGIWLGVVSNGLGAGNLAVFIIGRLKGML